MTEASNPGSSPGSDPEEERRRRYGRASKPARSLTPKKALLLRYLGECGILTTHQLAAIADYTEKAARNHLRDLFDAGLVDVVPVTRAALAGPEAANDESLLYGSAPNVYRPTRAGLNLLYEAGLTDRIRPVPEYGPKNALFLAHELQVRDFRVWLEKLCRRYEHRVEVWRDGTEAHIGPARPDAWFAYRANRGAVLLGLLEVDRGTERGLVRWDAKLRGYAELFSGTLLKDTTGYERGRVFVVAPDAARRDRLAQLIAGSPGQDRYQIAEASVLERTDLRPSVWTKPTDRYPVPFIPLEYV